MNVLSYYKSDWLGFEWSDWRSFDPANEQLSRVPTDEGLYRIRHQNRDGLEYIGQTGRSLRGRLRALSGCYKEDMPYTDPHVAAPCLWTIHQEDGSEFGFSWIAPDVATERGQRLAIEEALIASYRREAGESPTANFGRMIPGYKRSSQRAGGIVGRKLKVDEVEPNTEAGGPPLPWSNANELLSDTWMGLEWSDPEPLSEAYQQIPTGPGLYRIWHTDDVPPLGYCSDGSGITGMSSASMATPV